MVDNPVSRLSTSLDDLALSTELKAEVETRTDAMWRESWAYHCDHQDKHLDAIALTNKDPEVRARVALLKEVIVRMRAEGMPEITAIEVI